MPKLYEQLDHQEIPEKNYVLEQLAVDPSSSVDGRSWYNTATDKCKALINGVARAFVTDDRTISPGLGLTGGGDLSANRTLTVDFATSGTSSATQATRADDSRLADSRPPSGAAGGDLSGTYPNPQIAALAVTDAEVATANKDGVAGTVSMRTLGVGAQQAFPGQGRIDQLQVPTSDVSFNSRKITNVADPVSATDAANKQYVDGAITGLDAKQSVRAATTANITLSAPQTIDTISVIAGDRVLVKDQTTVANNGIYTVAAGAWVRATDFDAWSEVPGAYVSVEQGSANVDTIWYSVADQGGTLGTTSITFSPLPGAGAVIGGNGLTKTGNTLDVNVDASSIEINTDTLRVKALGITNAMLAGLIDLTTKVTGLLPLANGGTGASTAVGARANLGANGRFTTTNPTLVAGTYSANINHGLNNTRPEVQFVDHTTLEHCIVGWKVIDANNIQIRADIAVTATALDLVVQG